MDVRVALPAGPEAAEVVQPGEGALDHPAPAAEAGAVLGAAAGDVRLDAPRPQLAAVFVVVVAAVGDHVVGALARSAALAGDRADAVDEGQQLGDVVAVGAGVGGQQRHPGGVDDQMVLGARAATVNRRGPGQSPLEERGSGWSRRSRATSRSGRPR
jgi:hypothetical protein